MAPPVAPFGAIWVSKKIFFFLCASVIAAPFAGSGRTSGLGILRAVLVRESRTILVLLTGSLMNTVLTGSEFDAQGPIAPRVSSRRVLPSLSRYMVAVDFWEIRLP